MSKRNAEKKQYENSYMKNKPLVGRTERQKEYLRMIKFKSLIFSTGPAGTGKTFVAAAAAAKALEKGETEKIILTRPAVEAEENLGFLPGDLDQKLAPYMIPFKEVLEEFLGASHVAGLIKAGRIEVQPLAYMQGRTFKNCWCILDEAQNTTPKQMKMFLTRLGEDSKTIINGDIRQANIKGDSGLGDALDRVGGHPQVGVIEFQQEDIIRSALAKFIVSQYEKGAL